MKAILICFLLVHTLPIYSAEISVDKLNKKIEQLENRVEILEKIIADQSKSGAKNQNYISNDRQLWRKLNKKMNQNDVRKLLGEPIKVESSVFTTWYYSKDFTHSYVRFGKNDIVNGWSEPE